jgi:hypothetical protein
MNEVQIFTEDPESELWRELLQYSYKANVERYLNVMLKVMVIH